MITREQLFALGVDSTPWTVALNQAFERFGINNAPRQAMFLAQCLHESGGFRHLVESLNYSADALVATWPHRFTRYEAIEMARDEVRIGERAYGGRMGNGPEGTGDGYRFRGRGIIQITGRENYGKCGAALKLNLLEHPELLEQPAAACSSAGWYWSTHGCNELADAGDFEGVTRRINGGLNGLADRKSWLTKVYHAMGTQPAAPIEDRSPPAVGGRAGVQYSDPSTRRGQPPRGGQMLPILAALLPTVLQLFSGRAQAQIAKATGADPVVADQFMQNLISVIGKQVGVPVTDDASAIQAVASLTSIPNEAAKAVAVASVETQALDYLDKLAPILDRLHGYQKEEWAASDASQLAAFERNKSDPSQNIQKPMMTFTMYIVAGCTLFTGVLLGIQMWLKDGEEPNGQLIILFVMLVTTFVNMLRTQNDWGFGSSKASAAKDVVIGELARRQ